MNRKGQGAEKISTIIIILVSMFILAFGIWQLSLSGKIESSKNACRVSLIAADKTNDPSKIKCDRQEVVIKGRDVFDGDTLDEDKLYRRIANAMYDCKSQIGSSNPYSDEGEEVYCLVCSELVFDDNFRKKIGNQKVGSPYYWLAENVPPNSKVSYHQFFTGSSPDLNELDVLRKKQSETFLDFSKNYVVLSRTDLKGWEFADLLPAAAVGGIIGSNVGRLGGFALGGVSGAGVFSWLTAPVGAVVGEVSGFIVGGAGGAVGYVAYYEANYSNGILFIPEDSITVPFATEPAKRDTCTYLVN